MLVNSVERPLLVFEYGGTARSGKGTIVADIGSESPVIATEETGADYRVLTWELMNEGLIEQGMPSEVVAAAVSMINTDYITHVISRRHEIVEENGLPSLYTEDVNGLVSSVSPIIAVRKAVKAGFTKRVEAVIEDDEHSILLVDGRNLGPLIKALPAATLVMRTFVSCKAVEAAIREVARNNQSDDYSAFKVAYAAILKRNNDDAQRTIDPVKPDADAISYWWDDDMFAYSSQKIANELYGGDLNRAVRETFSGFREYTDVVRHGGGSKAVITGRQMNFDTTFFRSYLGDPKHRMLEAAQAMFNEALAAHTAIAAGDSPEAMWLRYFNYAGYSTHRSTVRA